MNYRATVVLPACDPDGDLLWFSADIDSVPKEGQLLPIYIFPPAIETLQNLKKFNQLNDFVEAAGGRFLVKEVKWEFTPNAPAGASQHEFTIVLVQESNNKKSAEEY